PTSGTRPDDSILVLDYDPDRTNPGSELAAVVFYSPMIEETGPTKCVANPKSPRRRCIQRPDVRGNELLAEGRMEQLKLPSVETMQSGGTAKPERAVGCLGQGYNGFWRTVLEGPTLVPELPVGYLDRCPERTRIRPGVEPIFEIINVRLLLRIAREFS